MTLGSPDFHFEPFLQLLAESKDYVYIKNTKGEFSFSNQPHLRLMGLSHLDQIQGKTDFDFVLPFLALRFQQQEQAVFEGKPIVKQVEVLSREGTHSFWHLTTKLPLKSREGKVVGLIGCTQKLAQEGIDLIASPEIRKALTYFQENFSGKIKMSDVAQISCLSVSALERRFQKELGMLPSVYLKSQRMNEACRMLAETVDSLSTISLECGFCDQAHFTAEFRKHFQITPLHYRKGLRAA